MTCSARSVAVTIDTPASPIIVYGTVLPWSTDKKLSPGTWANNYAVALRSQVNDWNKLAQEAGEVRLVVAGDLNQALSHDGKYYYGPKEGRDELVNALSDAKLKCLTGFTSDPVHHHSDGEHQSIDHICVSLDWAHSVKPDVLVWPNCNEVGAKPKISDHFGVCMELAD